MRKISNPEKNCLTSVLIDQYEYWKHTELILDVTQGRGSSFSIEIPMGIRFLIRSRLFTMEELKVPEIQDQNNLN